MRLKRRLNPSQVVFGFGTVLHHFVFGHSDDRFRLFGVDVVNSY